MFNFISNLRLEINGLFFSKTLRNTGVVFGGSIIASIFSLITILILSRNLGPEIYGVFSLIGSIVLLLIGVTDFGIATTLSKFTAPLKDKSSIEAGSFFRSVFWIKVISGFIIILLGLIFLGPISQWLGGDYLKGPLVLGFVIAGVLSFYAYIPAVLQALQRFWTISFISIFSNFLKLLLVVIIFYFSYLTLRNVLYINLFTALAALFFGLLIIPKFFEKKIDIENDLKSTKKLFSFTKWLALSYILNAVAARLDILFLSHFRSSTEVGYYALAFQLSSVFPLLLGAVATVLIPKVSTLKTQDQLGQFIVKGIKIAILIAPLLLISIIIVPSVIKVLFSFKYINSVPILQILLLNYFLILIINPLSYVLYVLDKPKILTLINTITLITLLLLQIYLVPNFGGIGAAFALLFNTMIAMVTLIITLIIFHKQGKIKI